MKTMKYAAHSIETKKIKPGEGILEREPTLVLPSLIYPRKDLSSSLCRQLLL